MPMTATFTSVSATTVALRGSPSRIGELAEIRTRTDAIELDAVPLNDGFARRGSRTARRRARPRGPDRFRPAARRSVRAARSCARWRVVQRENRPTSPSSSASSRFDPTVRPPSVHLACAPHLRSGPRYSSTLEVAESTDWRGYVAAPGNLRDPTSMVGDRRRCRSRFRWPPCTAAACTASCRRVGSTTRERNRAGRPRPIAARVPAVGPVRLRRSWSPPDAGTVDSPRSAAVGDADHEAVGHVDRRRDGVVVLEPRASCRSCAVATPARRSSSRRCAAPTTRSSRLAAELSPLFTTNRPHRDDRGDRTTRGHAPARGSGREGPQEGRPPHRAVHVHRAR